jgi:hypothetical protein
MKFDKQYPTQSPLGYLVVPVELLAPVELHFELGPVELYIRESRITCRSWSKNGLLSYLESRKSQSRLSNNCYEIHILVDNRSRYFVSPLLDIILKIWRLLTERVF